MNAPESKIDKLLDLLHSENMSNAPAGGRATPRGLNLNFNSRGSSARRPQNLPFTQRTEGEEPDKNDRRLKEIMKSSGKVKIRGITYNTELKDMEHIEELGYGTCGHVVKMRHSPSGDIIAVKQMRRTGNNEENKRIVMDIEVVIKSHGCPYIVQCLGCFITEAEVWICMELMATCFDKLLKRLGKPIPEHILGKVTVATVKALAYLKDKHGIIHRDVKPSNILLDERGNVKLCDFGISGRLVDSMAATKSAGCTAYLAPERIEIDPKNPDYDIRADVWSLGITLVELATGLFPYQDCKTDFEVLAKVISQDPPTLPADKDFTPDFRSFVNCCLIKDQKQRPKYVSLKEEPFYKKYEEAHGVNVGEWFVNAMCEAEGKETSSFRQPPTTTNTTRRAHTRQHSEPPPRTTSINGSGRSLFSPTSDASEMCKPETGSHHVSRITSFQREMASEKQPVRTYSPFQAYQNHLQAKNSCPQPPRFSEYMQQERYTSPIMHRRGEEKKDRWNSPVSTSLTRNQEEMPYNSGNTSPLVLQRFYHQQKQQQQAKEAEDYIKNEPALGRKRIASYIKLQLNDRSGRSSRHQSPEPPPRLNRGNGDSQSPLALRRHFYENSATTSPVSSRRYISPTPPVPPPRRLSESTSVPGSPQHVRARFHYTPEPQRRLFQNNDVS